MAGVPAVAHSAVAAAFPFASDRKSTRLNSSHLVISYAVFCLKKKKTLLLLMLAHNSALLLRTSKRLLQRQYFFINGLHTRDIRHLVPACRLRTKLKLRAGDSRTE